jgi:predicted Zn finger-like uncharacterized protein
MDTHITGKCPSCGADFRLRAHAAGRRARCRTCKEVFVVPGKQQASAAEDDVLSWLDRPSKKESEALSVDHEGEEEEDDEDASQFDASAPGSRR